MNLPITIQLMAERISRGEFISKAGTYITMTGLMVWAVDRIIEGDEAEQKAQSEYPNPIPQNQYEESKQFITKSDKEIVELAQERRYEEIPAIAENPLRPEAQANVELFEQNKLQQSDRHVELLRESFGVQEVKLR